jgi:hypothetical protein
MSNRASAHVSLLIARELTVDEAVAELSRAYRIYRQSRDAASWNERHEIELKVEK